MESHFQPRQEKVKRRLPMNLRLSIPLLLFAATLGLLRAEDDLKPYMKPEEGQERHVVRLPVLEGAKEKERKVEIVISKVEKLDPANRYFYGGEIVEKTVKGWGYPYFELSKVGPLAGTLIGVPPGTPKVERKILVNGGLGLIRYNSKLPIVVYTPKGFDVEVLVWSAGDVLKAKPE